MLNAEQQTVIRSVADKYTVPVDFALGIIEKESAGKAFYDVAGHDLPAIRIEGHYFYKRLSGVQRDEAVKAGLAAKKAGAVKNPTSMAGRYTMLDRMAKINADAAYQSISIGIGQVMGSWFARLGYGNAQSMWINAKNTFEGQAEQMIKFIATDPALLKYARAYDYKAFGKLYNGPAMLDSYPEDLEMFVRKYGSAVQVTDPYKDRIKELGYESTEAFQTEKGLKVDGIIGKITREAIEAELAARKKVADKPVLDSAIVGTIATGAGAVVAVTQNTNVIGDLITTVQPLIESIHSFAPMGPGVVMAVAAVVAAFALYKGVGVYLANRKK